MLYKCYTNVIQMLYKCYTNVIQMFSCIFVGKNTNIMFEFHYQQYMLLNYSLHFFGQLPLVQLYIYRD